MIQEADPILVSAPQQPPSKEEKEKERRLTNAAIEKECEDFQEELESAAVADFDALNAEATQISDKEYENQSLAFDSQKNRAKRMSTNAFELARFIRTTHEPFERIKNEERCALVHWLAKADAMAKMKGLRMILEHDRSTETFSDEELNQIQQHKKRGQSVWHTKFAHACLNAECALKAGDAALLWLEYRDVPKEMIEQASKHLHVIRQCEEAARTNTLNAEMLGELAVATEEWDEIMKLKKEEMKTRQNSMTQEIVNSSWCDRVRTLAVETVQRLQIPPGHPFWKKVGGECGEFTYPTEKLLYEVAQNMSGSVFPFLDPPDTDSMWCSSYIRKTDGVPTARINVRPGKVRIDMVVMQKTDLPNRPSCISEQSALLYHVALCSNGGREIEAKYHHQVVYRYTSMTYDSSEDNLAYTLTRNERRVECHAIMEDTKRKLEDFFDTCEDPEQADELALIREHGSKEIEPVWHHIYHSAKYARLIKEGKVAPQSANMTVCESMMI